MAQSRHLTPDWPLAGLPELTFLRSGSEPPPTQEYCYELWDKYHMPDNIRAHSQIVADIAKTLAKRANQKGITVNYGNTYASGLLHDLAKTWCLKYGGSHAMLGASWTLQETGNYAVAQGVLLHVHWPWAIPDGEEICQLPILVIYADKRTRHGQCVTLKERFDDLLVRYGKTEKARTGILASLEQTRIMEKRLSQQLEWNLYEDSFDCRRLVQ